MNDKKNSLELKTKGLEKEIETSDGKKWKVKIEKDQTVKINDKVADDGKKVTGGEVKAKFFEAIDANKDKKWDSVTEEKIVVNYKKGTWWPYLEIAKLGTKEVKEPKNVTLAVQGNKYWWPTWTLIILGCVIVVAITVALIWSLFKKDGDEE